MLDLRRPEMQKNLMLRYRVAMEVRKFLGRQGFIDIETPMLTRARRKARATTWCPSAHDGSSSRCRSRPQLFKQLLMMAGFDRYYQITKCFRDEDLRADRQPEFTQIDIETSFLTEEEIRDITEGMIRAVFKEAMAWSCRTKFPVMTYAERCAYGSDKPDLRVKLEFTELTDVMKTTTSRSFGGRPPRRRPRGGAAHSGRRGDEPRRDRSLHRVRQDLRRQGPAWIKVNDVAKVAKACSRPIVKNLHDAAKAEIIAAPARTTAT